MWIRTLNENNNFSSYDISHDRFVGYHNRECLWSPISYTNSRTKYGIQFQYPSDWAVDEKTGRFDGKVPILQLIVLQSLLMVSHSFNPLMLQVAVV